MRGVNRVILLGNLGQDPEVRYMTNGEAVANFTVATSESWTDQQGQKQERTEWHRIVVYRKLAEIVGQFLHKGSKVYLEGKLQTREWTDQQGQKRYTTEIVCHEMQMLDSKQDGASFLGAQAQQAAQQRLPQRQAAPQQGYAAARSAPMAPPPDYDDNVPF